MDYNELAKFLDLVSNADKYSAKLKELKAQEDSIKEAASKLGKLQEAEALFHKANDTVVKAQLEAGNIIADANVYASKQKELVIAEYKDIEAQRRVVGDIRQQGLDAEARAKAMLADLEISRKGLAKEKALVDAKMEEVHKLKDEYTERLNKLRSVMA
jgi:chromosome segregation ATPase